MVAEIRRVLAVGELCIDKLNITDSEVVANGVANVVFDNTAPDGAKAIAAWEKLTINGSDYYKPLFQ